MENFVFRADAGYKIGIGHFMRCFSLAQHVKEAGGNAVFAMVEDLPSLKLRLKLAGIQNIPVSAKIGSLDDARQTLQIAESLNASWIVLDGYHFCSQYQHAIKNSGIHLLLIDDLALNDYYYADIVLNQNLYADAKQYSKREPYTSLLLGSDYVVLRNEFLKWQGWRREYPKVASNLLVTLGGSESQNLTHTIVRSIHQLKQDNLVTVLVAANNSQYRHLKAEIKRSKAEFQIRKEVENMSELMAWADVAVSGGGTTTWELAFMGLPMVVIAVAYNQRQVIEELDKVGAAVSLGWYKNLSQHKIACVISELLNNPKMRKKMSIRAQRLIDGKGAERILEEIKRVTRNAKTKAT